MAPAPATNPLSFGAGTGVLGSTPAPAPTSGFGFASALTVAPVATPAFGKAPATSGFGFGVPAAGAAQLFGAAPAPAPGLVVGVATQEVMTPETRYEQLPEGVRKQIGQLAAEIKR